MIIAPLSEIALWSCCSTPFTTASAETIAKGFGLVLTREYASRSEMSNCICFALSTMNYPQDVNLVDHRATIIHAHAALALLARLAMAAGKIIVLLESNICTEWELFIKLCSGAERCQRFDNVLRVVSSMPPKICGFQTSIRLYNN